MISVTMSIAIIAVGAAYVASDRLKLIPGLRGRWTYPDTGPIAAIIAMGAFLFIAISPNLYFGMSGDNPRVVLHVITEVAIPLVLSFVLSVELSNRTPARVFFSTLGGSSLIMAVAWTGYKTN